MARTVRPPPPPRQSVPATRSSRRGYHLLFGRVVRAVTLGAVPRGPGRPGGGAESSRVSVFHHPQPGVRRRAAEHQPLRRGETHRDPRASLRSVHHERVLPLETRGGAAETVVQTFVLRHSLLDRRAQPGTREVRQLRRHHPLRGAGRAGCRDGHGHGDAHRRRARARTRVHHRVHALRRHLPQHGLHPDGRRVDPMDRLFVLRLLRAVRKRVRRSGRQVRVRAGGGRAMPPGRTRGIGAVQFRGRHRGDANRRAVGARRGAPVPGVRAARSRNQSIPPAENALRERP